MNSKLAQFRDYCRAMATADTDAAALWTQLADEIDEYEAGVSNVSLDLFGTTTAEPVEVER